MHSVKASERFGSYTTNAAEQKKRTLAAEGLELGSGNIFWAQIYQTHSSLQAKQSVFLYSLWELYKVSDDFLQLSACLPLLSSNSQD